MNKIYLKLLLTTVFILPPSAGMAFDETLTINGFEIPNRWFDSYDKQHNAHKERCGQIDESYLIEQMISLVLPVQAAEKQGLMLSEEVTKDIERWLVSEDDFPGDTDPSYNAKGEAIYLKLRRDRLRQLLSKTTTDEQVLAEYNKRKENNDPEIINRQSLKILKMTFQNEADATEVYELATAGEDYQSRAKELMGQSDFDWALEDVKNWDLVVRPKVMPEGEAEFSIGDAFYFVEEWYTSVSVVMDSKIEPVVELDGSDSVYKLRDFIESNLRRDVYHANYRELRNKADVRLNGEVLPAPDYDFLEHDAVYRNGLVVQYCTTF